MTLVSSEQRSAGLDFVIRFFRRTDLFTHLLRPKRVRNEPRYWLVGMFT